MQQQQILLDYLGTIAVQGIDAKTFLQGQLTCDVNKITVGKSALGAHCTPKGRIVSSFRLWQISNDHYLLTLPKNNIDNAINSLNKYAIFSKVKITDVSNHWAICGSTIETELKTFNAKQPLLIAKTSNHPQFEILTEKSDIKTTASNAWRLLNIQQQLATVYAESSGLFTPHDINYPQIGGVSFNKGCYTGQEIVARMQHRGSLKTHLYLIRFELTSTLIAGVAIYSESSNSNIKGYIVDCQLDNNQQALALVSIKDDMLNQPRWLINDEMIAYRHLIT